MIVVVPRESEPVLSKIYEVSWLNWEVVDVFHPRYLLLKYLLPLFYVSLIPWIGASTSTYVATYANWVLLTGVRDETLVVNDIMKEGTVTGGPEFNKEFRTSKLIGSKYIIVRKKKIKSRLNLTKSIVL